MKDFCPTTPLRCREINREPPISNDDRDDATAETRRGDATIKFRKPNQRAKDCAFYEGVQTHVLPIEIKRERERERELL